MTKINRDDRCRTEVPHVGGSERCQRRATRDGFCYQHHPEAAAKRSKSLNAYLKAEQQLRDAQYEQHRLEQEMVQVLAREDPGYKRRHRAAVQHTEACGRLYSKLRRQRACGMRG